MGGCTKPSIDKSSIQTLAAATARIDIQQQLIDEGFARVQRNAQLRAQHASLPGHNRRQIVESELLPRIDLVVDGPAHER